MKIILDDFMLLEFGALMKFSEHDFKLSTATEVGFKAFIF